jgi:hypothetical protein
LRARPRLVILGVMRHSRYGVSGARAGYVAIDACRDPAQLTKKRVGVGQRNEDQMSQDVPEQNRGSALSADHSEYAVLLPCTPDEFGDFVSGLLGKPQTIEKSIRGVFEFTHDAVANTFHLVKQRIDSQNEATLIQFTIRIEYDDNSSVLLNSLQDFLTYSEVRQIASVGVALSWVYLVKFKNSNVPEKQEIYLSFRTGDDDEVGNIFAEDDGVFIIQSSRRRSLSGVFLRIRHTDRTWGTDLESLLTGHVKTLMKTPQPTEKFIYGHSGEIGFTCFDLVLIGAIVGVLWTFSSFVDSYQGKLKALSDTTSHQADQLIISKIDFLLEVISSGAWPRLEFAAIGFLAISLVIAIFLDV